MCMIDYADSYGTWVNNPHVVKARKDHRCQNCGKSIGKGDDYWYGKWLEHGEGFSTVKHCVHCVVAADWLNKVCSGHLWGGTAIYEDLAEHWDEEDQFRCRSFALLLAAMRRKWDGVSIKKAEGLTKFATAHALRVMESARV